MLTFISEENGYYSVKKSNNYTSHWITISNVEYKSVEQSQLVLELLYDMTEAEKYSFSPKNKSITIFTDVLTDENKMRILISLKKFGLLHFSYTREKYNGISNVKLWAKTSKGKSYKLIADTFTTYTLEDISPKNLNETFDEFEGDIITSQETKFISYDEDNLDEFHQELLDSETNGNILKSGFSFLDEVLCGGFQAQNLYIFAGATGGGKSIVLQNLVYNISHFNHVILNDNMKPCIVYLSMENTEKDIRTRKMNYFGFRNCFTVKDENEYKTIKQNYMKTEKEYFNIKVFELYVPSQTKDTGYLDELYSRLEDKGYKMIALVQDYITRINPIKPISDENYITRNVSDEMKTFANEKNVAVITACQFSMDGLKDSNSKKINYSEIENITESKLSGGVGGTFNASFICATKRNIISEDKLYQDFKIIKSFRMYDGKNFNNIWKVPYHEEEKYGNFKLQNDDTLRYYENLKDNIRDISPMNQQKNLKKKINVKANNTTTNKINLDDLDDGGILLDLD